MRISDWSSDVCSSDLSRAVEEGGTLASPLIPWNAGGAFVISALALGVSSGNMENLLYIPLAFACWMSPVIGIVYAHTGLFRSEEHTSELQSLMRISYAVFCLNKKNKKQYTTP